MLDIAYLHKDALAALLARACQDPRCRWYHAAGWDNFNTTPEDSDWNEVASVSINAAREILGYLRVGINRWSGVGHGLAIITFAPNSMTFKRDLWRFLREVVTGYGLRKLQWTVVVGNPAEAMYDRVATVYGGRIVGTWTKNCRLRDGSYADEKLYEVDCAEAARRLGA